MTDHLMYTAKKNGGLGFPKLNSIIGIAQLSKLAHTARMQEDESFVRLAVIESKLNILEDRIIKALGVEVPYNLKTLEHCKQVIKDKAFQDWSKLTSQGKGVNYFQNYPLANSFLYEDDQLPDNRFIDALKLRTNTAGVRVALARAGGVSDKSCRHCRHPLETLGHVIGKCTLHAQRRIARHNAIVKMLTKHFGLRGFTISVEPTIKLDRTVLKPDLIICKGNSRTVIDVTVRFEDDNMAERAKQDKEQKYGILKDYFSDGKTFSVVPIILGARGAIPKYTKCYFKRISLPRFIQKKISVCALRSSIEIVNCHLDY